MQKLLQKFFLQNIYNIYLLVARELNKTRKRNRRRRRRKHNQEVSSSGESSQLFIPDQSQDILLFQELIIKFLAMVFGIRSQENLSQLLSIMEGDKKLLIVEPSLRVPILDITVRRENIADHKQVEAAEKYINSVLPDRLKFLTKLIVKDPHEALNFFDTSKIRNMFGGDFHSIANAYQTSDMKRCLARTQATIKGNKWEKILPNMHKGLGQLILASPQMAFMFTKRLLDELILEDLSNVAAINAYNYNESVRSFEAMVEKYQLEASIHPVSPGGLIRLIREKPKLALKYIVHLTRKNLLVKFRGLTRDAEHFNRFRSTLERGFYIKFPSKKLPAFAQLLIVNRKLALCIAQEKLKEVIKAKFEQIKRAAQKWNGQIDTAKIKSPEVLKPVRQLIKDYQLESVLPSELERFAYWIPNHSEEARLRFIENMPKLNADMDGDLISMAEKCKENSTNTQNSAIQEFCRKYSFTLRIKHQEFIGLLLEGSRNFIIEKIINAELNRQLNNDLNQISVAYDKEKKTFGSEYWNVRTKVKSLVEKYKLGITDQQEALAKEIFVHPDQRLDYILYLLVPRLVSSIESIDTSNLFYRNLLEDNLFIT